MTLRQLMIAGLTLSVLGPVFAIADWELQADKDGIRVFTMAMPDSEFDAFMAETTLDASLSTVMAVHFDVPAVTDWMENCDDARLLSDHIGASGYNAYFRTDSPWPVSDRDYILTYSIQQDPSDYSVVLSFTTVDGLVPVEEGTVRVNKLDGFWKMTPIVSDATSDTPQTRIIYQVNADPGGNIPGWLANSFTVEQPFASLKRLRQQVKMEKYQGKHYGFIKDPLKP